MRTNYDGIIKVKTLEEMLRVREFLRKEGKTLIFTNGCYDLLHPGHIRLLQKAAKLGDYLLIAVNSDSSIRRIKGKVRPVMPLEVRLEMLCSLEVVDGVMPFDEDVPLYILRQLKPDIYVKGRGYERREIPEADIVEAYGGKVFILPPLSDYSTTGIIKTIQTLPT